MLRRRGLREKKIDRGLAVIIVALPKDFFFAVVEALLIEGRLLVAHGPAGERAGELLDIALGVVTYAEREELHHLARVVLVRLALAIGLPVEPDEHRRIAPHRDRKLT